MVAGRNFRQTAAGAAVAVAERTSDEATRENWTLNLRVDLHPSRFRVKSEAVECCSILDSVDRLHWKRPQRPTKRVVDAAGVAVVVPLQQEEDTSERVPNLILLLLLKVE